eukprot:COSAG02_NODE_4813_length_4949_cov_2.146598_2_plen_182_part_00
MERVRLVTATVLSVLPTLSAASPPTPPRYCAGVLLWNGICTPSNYPNYSLADSYGARVTSLHQPLPPYLRPPPQHQHQHQDPPTTSACLGCRPTVINISIGRQLFVDDFLVRNSSGIGRTYFPVTYDNQNPVVAPTEPWEIQSPDPQGLNDSSAMAYSGGIAYDVAEADASKRYKLWYSCG